jgi:hypothetical protein
LTRLKELNEEITMKLTKQAVPKDLMLLNDQPVNSDTLEEQAAAAGWVGTFALARGGAEATWNFDSHEDFKRQFMEIYEALCNSVPAVAPARRT